MKRFVTYLYEYENGVKTKSTGFIRVDIRGMFVNIEICIRKFLRSGENGKVYALVSSHGLKGLFLGEIKVFGGQGDLRLQLSAGHLRDTDVSIDDLVGIGIRFANESYIASCWEDAYAQEIGRGIFEEYRDEKITDEQISVVEADVTDMQMPVAEADEVDRQVSVVKADISDRQTSISEVQTVRENTMHEEIMFEREISKDKDDIASAPEKEEKSAEIAVAENLLPQEKQYMYKKIDLTHMHEIPLQDRHYSSNAFLIHGFWNYGYLILKTEMEGDKKKASLGVPGVYERQEAAMAMAFSFPVFETIPEKMRGEPLFTEQVFFPQEIKQSQQPKDRAFGCWFAALHT